MSGSNVILTPDEHRKQQQHQGRRLPGGLDGGISVPPGWKAMFGSATSSLGTYVDIFANVWRYQVKTEDVAEFLAVHLMAPEGLFKNQRVGVIYSI